MSTYVAVGVVVEPAHGRECMEGEDKMCEEQGGTRPGLL